MVLRRGALVTGGIYVHHALPAVQRVWFVDVSVGSRRRQWWELEMGEEAQNSAIYTDIQTQNSDICTDIQTHALFQEEQILRHQL